MSMINDIEWWQEILTGTRQQHPDTLHNSDHVFGAGVDQEKKLLGEE